MSIYLLHLGSQQVLVNLDSKLAVFTYQWLEAGREKQVPKDDEDSFYWGRPWQHPALPEAFERSLCRKVKENRMYESALPRNIGGSVIPH